MNILLINKFLYPKGGDARCTIETGKLLSEKGHDVVFWGMKHPANPEYPYSKYFVDSIDYDEVLSIKEKTCGAFNILYSLEAKHKISALMEKIVRPDIIHLHNFAHQISPSVLSVFKKHKIPVVMTMHDYKLVCPSYSLFADGKPCQACSGGKYWNCFSLACVKGSKLKSLINTIEMMLHHKIFNIYKNVDVFISPSCFLKDKLYEMGFKGKIKVLPNFINFTDFVPQYGSDSNTICYVGRLSKEKGVATLIKSVKGLDVELKIIGDGPVRQELESFVTREGITNVKFLGYCLGDTLKDEVRSSLFMIIPSECYENNPFSVIEAFALGKPVIGARIGGIPELVKDGQTGMTFESGNVDDLRSKIKTMIQNTEGILQMGKNARAFVALELNAEVHYKKLMQIYAEAIKVVR